ncbi:hypothetical protein FRB93_012964 [Tulasnella sp. JGI-2019a]|nr:hypothetical protein FRB93_012964 [Tulasnella sp. JGI-2019a]
MTQSPGKAHNPEPTAMPSDKMKVIPSKSNRKASDDARKGALGSAARAGPAKAIAGNPSASRRKIASSSTLTTATESRDAGRRPPALSSSSAGPSKSSVSTSPQKSSTRKLSFTKNSKLNPSALLQTSPAIITDKHRGARIMMVDGLPALPPERPRANKPSYSKLVKKLPKANTATAGNFMLSLPPKWPRRFSRLTAEKPPADATPNNTQAPSQSDAADNALSGCDDASPKMTCGSTGVQREAPEHCPGLLTEEPPSMFNIELVNGSSAETIPVNCGGAVNTDGDYASVLNTSRGASTDVICHAPWIGDIELKLAGGGGATLRASLTSASSTGTVNPLVPVDIFRSLSGITFERTYSIEDYVNLIKPAHGPVREFAMVEDSDSDDKNRKWIKNLAAYLEDTNQIAMGFIEMSDAVFHRCIVIIVSLNSDQLDSVFNAPVLTGLMSSSLLLALIPQVHDQQLRIDLHSSSSKIHVITTDSSHGALPADRPEGQVQGSTSPSFSMGLRLKPWPALDKEQYYLPYRHTIAHLQLTDGDMEFLYQKEFAMFPDEDARMDVETRAVFNLMTRLLKAKNVHLVDMNAKAVLIHRKSILDLANLPKLHKQKRDFPDFVFYTYG